MVIFFENEKRFMNLFKKYSYWVHSGKYTAIQKFSVLGMGIVSFMLLTRSLEPAGFGVWGLFLTISGITEAARTALLRNGFIRFMHQTPESEHGKLQSASFMLSLWVSAGLAVLFFALAGAASMWLNAADCAFLPGRNAAERQDGFPGYLLDLCDPAGLVGGVHRYLYDWPVEDIPGVACHFLPAFRRGRRDSGHLVLPSLHEMGF
jgi:hypothetical protein